MTSDHMSSQGIVLREDEQIELSRRIRSVRATFVGADDFANRSRLFSFGRPDLKNVATACVMAEVFRSWCPPMAPSFGISGSSGEC